MGSPPSQMANPSLTASGKQHPSLLLYPPPTGVYAQFTAAHMGLISPCGSVCVSVCVWLVLCSKKKKKTEKSHAVIINAVATFSISPQSFFLLTLSVEMAKD